MNYIGIAARVAPFLGRKLSGAFRRLAGVVKANPKSSDATLAVSAVAGWLGLDPTTRATIGKVLVLVGQLLQSAP